MRTAGIILIGVCVLGGLLAYYTMGRLADPARPVSRCNGGLISMPAPYDFGPIDPDAVIDHTFDIENRTDDPIVVAKVIPDCGLCTAIKRIPKTIMPGETGQIEMQFIAKGKRGPGKQYMLVYVDGHEKPYAIEYSVFVLGFDIEPNALDLGHVSRSGPLSKRLALIAYGRPAWDISVEEAPPGLAVTIGDRTTLKEGTPYETVHLPIIVTLDPNDCAPGRYFGGLTLKCTDPRSANGAPVMVRVPVAGYVSGEIDVSPPRVSFGRILEGTRLSRRCYIGLPVGESAEDITLASDTGVVQGTIGSETSEDGQRLHFVDVSISLPSSAAEAPRDTRILKGALTISDRSGKELASIPWIAYCAVGDR